MHEERNQEGDAQTMRPRMFSVELTDSDVRRIYELAGRKGTTPAKILQGFICDLVDGSHTNGSDERMMAIQYLNRCGYCLEDDSFLSWALYNCRLEEAAALLADIDGIGGADGETAAAELAELETELAELHGEYAADQARRHGAAQGPQEAAESVRSYLQELEWMGAAAAF